ncbi:MAG: hypothetical protein OXT65_05365, partial [Alphaproteobacteria bacterium]|nr:hypothetical protein [Alphaproteobacteria bacterium]
VQPLEDTDNYKTLFQHADVVLTVEPYIPSIDSRLSKRLEIKKYVPVLKFSPQKEKRLSGYMVLDKSGNIKKANCKTHDVEAPLEDNFLKRCLLMSLGLNNIDDVHDPQYALNLLYSSKLRSGMNKQELMSALDKIEEER